MYAKALEGDLEKYKEIAASESFADFYQDYRNLSYDRLASSRGFDGNEEKLELVKKLREMGKDAVKKMCIRDRCLCEFIIVLGQLNAYVGYYKKNEMIEGEMCIRDSIQQ